MSSSAAKRKSNSISGDSAEAAGAKKSELGTSSETMKPGSETDGFPKSPKTAIGEENDLHEEYADLREKYGGESFSESFAKTFYPGILERESEEKDAALMVLMRKRVEYILESVKACYVEHALAECISPSVVKIERPEWEEDWFFKSPFNFKRMIELAQPIIDSIMEGSSIRIELKRFCRERAPNQLGISFSRFPMNEQVKAYCFAFIKRPESK